MSTLQSSAPARAVTPTHVRTSTHEPVPRLAPVDQPRRRPRDLAARLEHRPARRGRAGLALAGGRRRRRRHRQRRAARGPARLARPRGDRARARRQRRRRPRRWCSGLSRWGGNARRPAGADAAHAAAPRARAAVHPLVRHRRDAEDPARRPRRRCSRSTSTSTRASAASTRSCSRPPASPGSRAAERLRHVVLPGALPSSLIGLRLAARHRLALARRRARPVTPTPASAT